MDRILLSLTTASILVMGCGQAALGPQAATSARPAVLTLPEKEVPKALAAVAPGASPSGEPKEFARGLELRAPGDFVVYRFSGSFRKAPLTLTERVLARRDTLLTVDVTADSANGAKQELRVKIDEASGANNEVVSVSRMESGMEEPASIEAYEALLSQTVLVADQNEALLGTENVTMDIGGAKLACRKTSYRVRIGKHKATMHTLESDAFAWGDVGGEITTEGGKVLYRAEVIEVGHVSAAQERAVAHSDIDL